MKKYLLTGGLAAVLMLGTCGNEEPEAAEEVVTEEGTEESENEAADDNSEALQELQAENDSLQNKVAELEEENQDIESLQDRISELETENEELEEIAAGAAEEDEQESASEDENDASEDGSGTEGEGTRSDPMPIGNTVQLDVIINGEDYDDRYEGAAELTINEVIIGNEAYDMLLAENQFNDPAPEGYQWALIHTNFELVESETDDHAYYVMDEFSIVEGDGSSAPRESAVTPDAYGSEDIYSGGTSSGYSAMIVPEDNDFLIHYDDFLYNSVFFEIN